NDLRRSAFVAFESRILERAGGSARAGLRISCADLSDSPAARTSRILAGIASNELNTPVYPALAPPTKHRRACYHTRDRGWPLRPATQSSRQTLASPQSSSHRPDS